jgi:hypothetical protein
LSDTFLEKLENYTSLIIDRETYSNIWFEGAMYKDVEELVTVFLSDHSLGSPDNTIKICFNGNFFSYDHKYCTDEDVTKNLNTMNNLIQPLIKDFELNFSSDCTNYIKGARYTLKNLKEGFDLGIYTKCVIK